MYVYMHIHMQINMAHIWSFRVGTPSSLNPSASMPGAACNGLTAESKDAACTTHTDTDFCKLLGPIPSLFSKNWAQPHSTP